ncbi:hypothetical protein PI124_g22298, partial [Phytophthora idaei]
MPFPRCFCIRLCLETVTCDWGVCCYSFAWRTRAPNGPCCSSLFSFRPRCENQRTPPTGSSDIHTGLTDEGKQEYGVVTTSCCWSSVELQGVTIVLWRLERGLRGQAAVKCARKRNCQLVGRSSHFGSGVFGAEGGVEERRSDARIDSSSGLCAW